MNALGRKRRSQSKNHPSIQLDGLRKTAKFAGNEAEIWSPYTSSPFPLHLFI
jgi:hypothetical protein